MSLSGLALRLVSLVDESTVTIENIHQHFDMGKPKALAIWDACKRSLSQNQVDLIVHSGCICTSIYNDGMAQEHYFTIGSTLVFNDYIIFAFGCRLLCLSWLTGHDSTIRTKHKKKTDPTITDDEDAQSGLG